MSVKKPAIIILGAGMTGLAAALASDAVVYEAEQTVGGICSSYYVRPGDHKRLYIAPQDKEAYRFERGGGHWIFGGDAAVLRFIDSLVSVERYVRRSSVYFSKQELYVPYPLQNYLRQLGKDTAVKALTEMVFAPKGAVRTMADWLGQSFGPTLNELFFAPFHELYTAGLWTEIAPQDAFKSPADLSLVIQGAVDRAPPPVGYNITFAYPREDLNTLAQRMAERLEIYYNKQVVEIDIQSKQVRCADGSKVGYKALISTLPLDQMMKITDLEASAESDPYTSVLALNIGAVRGPKCPDDHWLYVPDSHCGFHRVGFYSNVDVSFLPLSSREDKDRTGIYVERTYPGGAEPSQEAIQSYSKAVVQELQDWGFIREPEVVSPTWIDVAYTWSWPASEWKQYAQKTLEKHDIFVVGRYGRWAFQGLADSIRDGLMVGSSVQQVVTQGA
jgi:protoporphyrinogen oxidase